MPYRGRAVKRVKGQRQMKPLNPTAKFTLTKTYAVTKGVATDNTYILRINASTPFDFESATNGLWSAYSPDVEPIGLNTDMYSHYRHLVVKGCNVRASVVDNLDNISLSEEKLCMGQLSIVRGTQNNAVTSVIKGPDLKRLYGQKTRDFTLAPRSDSLSGMNAPITKSAFCSNGYSAKKTWNCDPNANDDLRVVNQSGSSNEPTDNTFLFVCVAPRDGNAGGFLQPMLVTVRTTYIIQFQEPTITQHTPQPYGMAQRSKRSNSNYYRQPPVQGPTMSQKALLTVLAGALGYGARRANRRGGNVPLIEL